MFSQEILNFSPFKIAFWVILYHTPEVITHIVPNAARNYKLCVLMHIGMKRNSFSYIISRQNLGANMDFFEVEGL